MTTIRVKPEELETVAKHVPDAEDACRVREPHFPGNCPL